MTREQLFELEFGVLGKHPTWMFLDGDKLVLVVYYSTGFVFYMEGGENGQ